MSKRRLGKGIDALLQGRPLDQLSQMSSIVMVEIDKISPSPNQPRKQFNQQSLNELADSIREKGIIQPIIAEDQGDGTFVIIAGERRYRAAKLAGLDEIPVISQDFSDDEKLEIALIENIQREDLNPIDEARALQHALDHSGVTQDQLAKRLGKSRSAIANALRLLRLDTNVQDALASGELTPGHARALLALSSDDERRRLFERIQADGLSVREAELAVKGGKLDLAALDRAPAAALDPTAETGSPAASVAPGTRLAGDSGGPAKSVELQRIEDRFVEHLGTRVVIKGSDEKGKIEIAYLSTDDLERIAESMGLSLGE
ncbi:MAG: ParB/RepB/Spo0J family partition protein [Spirochaetota bacterium]